MEKIVVRIMYPQPVHQVMVSSTFKDLKEHRAALIKAIHKLKPHANVVEHDDTLAGLDVDVIESSLQMVRESVAYILLIGFRYGQTPECPARNPKKLSITELEFDEAQKLDRPILVFIMGEKQPTMMDDVETDPEKKAKLDAFRERAKSFSVASMVNRIYALFNSLQDFKGKLGGSLGFLFAIPRAKDEPLSPAAAPKRPKRRKRALPKPPAFSGDYDDLVSPALGGGGGEQGRGGEAGLDLDFDPGSPAFGGGGAAGGPGGGAEVEHDLGPPGFGAEWGKVGRGGRERVEIDLGLPAFVPGGRKLRARSRGMRWSAPTNLLGELSAGKFAKEEVRRKPKAGIVVTEPNPVDCTVFAPERAGLEQSGLLQVFLHAPGDRKKAEKAAQKADRAAEERGHRSLVLDAPHGTIFDFEVEIEGIEVARTAETLLWTGLPEAAAFPFKVPKRAKLGQHVGTVFVSKGGVPVASISFQIEVVLCATPDKPRPTGDAARHYESCFCSYSTLDRAEMLKREQGLRAAGLETFVDAVNLRPGDVFSPKIFEAIRESDLFVVIWSKNASASDWVLKETRYALELRARLHRPDFCPIPVDGPPIAPVPIEWRATNFNDERLLLIRAAELEAAERAKIKRRGRNKKGLSPRAASKRRGDEEREPEF